MFALIIDLAFLALVGYAGYTAYTTYVERGNSISPLDEYFAAFTKKLFRK
jgi:hypothetical protein